MAVTEKYRSATHYIISAIVPYTEANLKLVFLPRRFFGDLAKLDSYKQKTLQNAFYHAVRDGYILLDEITGKPILTEKGVAISKLYNPEKLLDSKLIIVFDVPESEAWKRRQLRDLLRQIRFTPIQKSVWQSSYDYRNFLNMEIDRLRLKSHVLLYEAREIKIP